MRTFTHVMIGLAALAAWAPGASAQLAMEWHAIGAGGESSGSTLAMVGVIGGVTLADSAGQTFAIQSGWIIAEPCVADFNRDGFLDFFDYDAFVASFEAADPSGRTADVNEDGFVDGFDYAEFIERFERGC